MISRNRILTAAIFMSFKLANNSAVSGSCRRTINFNRGGREKGEKLEFIGEFLSLFG